MPAPSRWLIRFSFVYLIIGMTIGALLLIQKAYPSYPVLWLLLPVHIELLIFGWIIQLTIGVAYWILPRFIKGPSRGNSTIAWIMVFLFNLGLWLTIIDPLISSNLPLSTAGRIAEVGVVFLFISLHWKRIASYAE